MMSKVLRGFDFFFTIHKSGSLALLLWLSMAQLDVVRASNVLHVSHQHPQLSVGWSLLHSEL
jgi:hypothetical protein